MHERLEERDLLPVPVRQGPDPHGQVELEPRGERANVRLVHPAAKRPEIGAVLLAGQLLVQAELARQVTDATADLEAVAMRVEPEDARAPSDG
jgi:hypothetical protein